MLESTAEVYTSISLNNDSGSRHYADGAVKTKQESVLENGSQTLTQEDSEALKEQEISECFEVPTSQKVSTSYCSCLCGSSNSLGPDRHRSEQDEWENFRTQWQKKWNGFLNTFKQNVLGTSGNELSDAAFSLLLQLYAHKPVMSEINELYEQDPKDFMFYLPQLCNVLLHGALAESQTLENFLLDKSEQSLKFSQKIVWLMKSYGHEKKKEVEFVKSVGIRGIKAAQKLSVLKPKGSQTPPTRNPPVVLIQNNTDKFKLLLLPRLYAGPPYVLGTSKFDWSFSFCNELTHFAEALKDIPPSDRNLALKSTLESLEGDYFPSDVLYLPIGRRDSRVVGIITEESFCFRTNERVPYMLCLEVIDDEIDTERTDMDEKETIGDIILDKFDKFGTQMEEWGSKIANTVKTPSVGKPSRKQFSPLSPSPRNTERSIELSNQTKTFPDDTKYCPVKRYTSTNGEDNEVDNTPKHDSDKDFLGQWKPKVNKPRGQGSSHFSFHDHMQGETRNRLQRYHSDERLAPVFSHANIGVSKNPIPSNKRHNSEVGIYHDDFETKHAHQAESNKTSIRTHEDVIKTSDTENDPLEKANEDGEVDNEETLSDKPDLDLVVFSEVWLEKENRIRKTRPWGSEPGWRLVPVIVKSNDDLRQEQFALQLISQFARIFQDSKLGLWLRPYDILAISSTSGLIEAVPDTISLDSLKKNDPNFISLKDFFSRFYSKEKVKTAKRNFCDSLAGYCIVSYLLQIKDRHNGNLLLHSEGYLIHIDFGFILSNSPGNMNFESSPFKLTNEFVQLLGGPDSALFSRFRKLCCQGFLAARKRMDEIILLVEMMRAGNGSLPCFKAGGEATVSALKDRFQPGLSKTGAIEFVNNLIDTSINHWRTRWYDRYQRCWVGIAY